MLHGPGLAGDLDTVGPQEIARLVDAGHFDGDVAKAVALVVGLGLVPVVGQLEGGVARFRAIADEGIGEAPIGVIRGDLNDDEVLLIFAPDEQSLEAVKTLLAE